MVWKSQRPIVVLYSNWRRLKNAKKNMEGPQIGQVSVHACATARQFVKFLVKTSLK